jgi:hypothetical protein
MKKCGLMGCGTAHAGFSLADFFTLKMEAIYPSKTLVHTRLHGATSQKTAFFSVYDVFQLDDGIIMLKCMVGIF